MTNTYRFDFKLPGGMRVDFVDTYQFDNRVGLSTCGFIITVTGALGLRACAQFRDGRRGDPAYKEAWLAVGQQLIDEVKQQEGILGLEGY